jgi:hypothetical protein
MNLFDLLYLSFFLSVGSGIGVALKPFESSLFGAIAGGIVGWSILYLICKFMDWSFKQWPSCTCGNNDFENFSLEISQNEEHFHKCSICNKKYIMRKGKFWYDISTNEPKLFMKRMINQKWRKIK